MSIHDPMTEDRFPIESLQDLRARVEYEDWLLESVYKLAEGELFPDWPDEVIYKLGAMTPQTMVYGRAHMILGDWRPGFLEAGAPLVFTASFKLLDMLFEWVLARNVKTADCGFQKKLQQLEQAGLSYPAILESRPWLIERLKGLYRESEPLRGTIIHSRHFSSTNGTLRVASSKRGVVGEGIDLEAADLRALAQVVVSVLRFLQGDWALTAYREKVLRRQLDQLGKLHKLDSLGQQEPRHISVRWCTGDPQIQNIDVNRIRRDLDASCSGQDVSFDLRVVVFQGPTAVEAYLIPNGDLSLLAMPQNKSRYRCDLPG